MKKEMKLNNGKRITLSRKAARKYAVVETEYHDGARLCQCVFLECEGSKFILMEPYDEFMKWLEEGE